MGDEVEEGKQMAEALVKQLTSGDSQKARFMHQDYFQFEATAKIFLIANHKPLVQGTHHAIWRRLRLLPFTVTIGDDERDRRLPEKLRRERAGILHWCIEGCLRWQREGLQPPAAVLAATKADRAEMDPLRAFFAACCRFDQPAAWTSSQALRNAYESWCREEGEREPVGGNRWIQRLREMGLAPRQTRQGRGWLGIYLVHADAMEQTLDGTTLPPATG